MDLRFNPRENGACPFCRKLDSCILRDRLRQSLADVKDAQSQGMELVIYACPMFQEKF